MSIDDPCEGRGKFEGPTNGAPIAAVLSFSGIFPHIEVGQGLV